MKLLLGLCILFSTIAVASASAAKCPKPRDHGKTITVRGQIDELYPGEDALSIFWRQCNLDIIAVKANITGTCQVGGSFVATGEVDICMGEASCQTSSPNTLYQSKVTCK